MAIFRIKKSVVQMALNTWDATAYSGSSPHGLNNKYKVIRDDEPVDVDLIRKLLDEGVRRVENDDLVTTTTLDQWLAPRIHSGMRISRRLAGDMGFWTWMLLEVGRPYTWCRWHERGDRVTAYRYIGDFKRNSLARLWWFAEMSRNGPSYSPIEDVLRDPSTAQYAMELRYSMYRPAVIAFGRIAREKRLGFAELKALSKRINAYLSLRALEEIGRDEGTESRDREWWTYQPALGELLTKHEIVGPRDSYAEETAVQDLVRWYEELARPAVAA